MFASRAHNLKAFGGTSGGASERGSVTLETVIVWPVVMILLFGMFQASLWLHARDVAHGAATVAYYEARTVNGTAAAAQTAGRGALAQASGSVSRADISVNRSPGSVSVTVSGSTSLIIDGWPGSSVSETVTGPVERYVAP